jgi:transcriptional regulator with XRE-family HTH domain
MTAYQIRENIRRLREFRNLNQEDVAERLQLSTRAYANIENGRAGMDIERLLQIADILHIPLLRLLTLHLNQEENLSTLPVAGHESPIFPPEQHQVWKLRQDDFVTDTAILPELMRQIEFLRQAYTEAQLDKSFLRSEIRELRSSTIPNGK